ncbi:MAG: RidA family protein [Acidobacteriaceae bacterium]|nr:RidA family protein [Acidobacteriaceae bacterium]
MKKVYLILGNALLLLPLSSFAQTAAAREETAVSQKREVGKEVVAAGTPYSPGILIGNSLYIAGLQGTELQTHKLPPEFAQEVRNCLENVGQVLKDAGMTYDDVVSVQIFLVDISQFPQVNEIYTEYFKGTLPARTTVQVAKLSLGSRIEISAIAQK